MEGDTFVNIIHACRNVFQSTPSAWRETGISTLVKQALTISIHSLRMEGDSTTSALTLHPSISIHSLRMEGDSTLVTHVKVYFIFQSTPSAWRETCLPVAIPILILFQSTPSAWRETAAIMQHVDRCLNFNPLPPHGGRHQRLNDLRQCINYFNPLPPHGGRPHYRQPRRRSDYFNPLPPHGGRPVSPISTIFDFLFQSTPSAWRETSGAVPADDLRQHFNPLPPHGGRLYNFDNVFCVELFQSTPSAWRETP